jgi:hypothetical protein
MAEKNALSELTSCDVTWVIRRQLPPLLQLLILFDGFGGRERG